MVLSKVARGSLQKLRALEEFDPVVGIVPPADIAVQLRSQVQIDSRDIVAPRMRRAARGLEVILQILGRVLPEYRIRQRQEIEHRLSPSVDPVLRNNVPREWGRGPRRGQVQR